MSEKKAGRVCFSCKGTGRLYRRKDRPDGVECKTCGGTGSLPEDRKKKQAPKKQNAD